MLKLKMVTRKFLGNFLNKKTFFFKFPNEEVS